MERVVTYSNTLPPQRLDGKWYPCLGTVKSKVGEVPLLDIHLMSDLDWHRSCLQSRLDSPELYRAIGEDVDAAVERLRAVIREMETQTDEQ